jgi:hypothetical protein
VKRAQTVGELVGNPVGRFYVGPSHLVWCASPSLCGSAHWGRPSADDARELTRLYDRWSGRRSPHDRASGKQDRASSRRYLFTGSGWRQSGLKGINDVIERLWPDEGSC